MAGYRRFHLPLSHQASKSSVGIIKSTNPQLISHSLHPSNEFQFHCQYSSPPTPVYNTSMSHDLVTSSTDIDLIFSQADLVDPYGHHSQPSFEDVQYNNNRSFSSDVMEIASPSKNNFARNHLNMMVDSQEDNDDTLTPSPVVEYDLGDSFFDGSEAGSIRQSSSHARSKSGESSTSSKWWKFSRQRQHQKSSSTSTHPTADTCRASSRSSSFASIRGNDFDINSSQASLSNQLNWAVETSPPVSPPMDNFMFPKLYNQPLSRNATANEVRQTFSRDGFARAGPNRSLHSKKSSLSSNGHSRQKSSQSIDNPTTFMLSSQDKWSMQLGHANYTIFPEPYTPDSFDLEGWHKLLQDREAAHAEYCKHLARTTEHYGPNSQTFKLTEAKWAEINTEWDKNIRMAKTCLMAQGVQASHLAATAASQNVRMPVLNPHMDGKFPKLGDEDIVGPMVQSEPMSSRNASPSRKPAATKWTLDKIFRKNSNSGD